MTTILREGWLSENFWQTPFPGEYILVWIHQDQMGISVGLIIHDLASIPFNLDPQQAFQDIFFLGVHQVKLQPFKIDVFWKSIWNLKF